MDKIVIIIKEKNFRQNHGKYLIFQNTFYKDYQKSFELSFEPEPGKSGFRRTDECYYSFNPHKDHKGVLVLRKLARRMMIFGILDITDFPWPIDFWGNLFYE